MPTCRVCGRVLRGAVELERGTCAGHDDLNVESTKLAAEAAERMRIVEDLADSIPYISNRATPSGWAMPAICRGCLRQEGEGHADGCLWLRARKAVRP